MWSKCLIRVNLISLYFPVYPGDREVTILGLEDLLENGATVEVTCSVLRIRPEAETIFWSMRGIGLGEGTTTTIQNTDGKTFYQESVISIT